MVCVDVKHHYYLLTWLFSLSSRVTPVILNELTECCFKSTETVGLLGTEAQDVHLDFHTAPELGLNESIK